MNTNDNADAIFESLDNCWRALCQRMRNNPTAETQQAMNLLARIIAETKSETKKRMQEANDPVSIEDWMAWFTK